jgi:hypothetical protein
MPSFDTISDVFVCRFFIVRNMVFPYLAIIYSGTLPYINSADVGYEAFNNFEFIADSKDT